MELFDDLPLPSDALPNPIVFGAIIDEAVCVSKRNKSKQKFVAVWSLSLVLVHINPGCQRPMAQIRTWGGRL
jgi:hypothetical protein